MQQTTRLLREIKSSATGTTRSLAATTEGLRGWGVRRRRSEQRGRFDFVPAVHVIDLRLLPLGPQIRRDLSVKFADRGG